MQKKTKLNHPDLILGQLPVDEVNLTLDLELEQGVVVFSSGAQKHAARRHPNEYPFLMPHAANIIANPLYIGDDLNNENKIEFIGLIPNSNSFALVAVSIVLDSN
jgi:hypothetical protein